MRVRRRNKDKIRHDGENRYGTRRNPLCGGVNHRVGDAAGRLIRECSRPQKTAVHQTVSQAFLRVQCVNMQKDSAMAASVISFPEVNHRQ
jgi:hypothetical protein